MKQTINVSIEKYNNNVVWWSCDPRTGKIVLYSAEHSNLIEEAYQKNHTVCEIDSFNALYLKSELKIFIEKDSNNMKEDNYYQTTPNGGYRSVGRNKLLDGENSIEANIEFNDKANAYFVMPPIEDNQNKKTIIVFVIDKSASMNTNDLFTKVHTEACNRFLPEQKCLPHEVTFSAITFSNTIDVLFNNIDLKSTDIVTIQNKFNSIKPAGCTAYYDAVMKGIDITDEIYNTGDEVIFCTMTDGLDNSSMTSLRNMSLKIKAKKSIGWNIVMIGTSDIDTENIGEEYGIGSAASIGILGNQASVNAVFRGLSAGVKRMRTGETEGIQWTADERNQSTQVETHT